ncbi:penicillin acylase family protein [Pseudoduganella ginsengisoli]|uniref:Penicillin acylase family protein n=1 Tax=Pseudoduganella ginsengisoli TaxID=1462440 RepID=A0A6L6PWV7_9BURK|nr:penicillin acylase family protein [Pseudoduganella ginsengisoli]MTW01458.1 penicillin acylase family protein [Pseudoduganella ginsengisoli]
MQKAGLGTWIKRIVLGGLLLVALAALAIWFFLRGSLAQLDGRRNVPGLSADVTVARDGQGVPTITGKNRLDIAYATGFVHAQERYFQMDLLRRSAAGELSELFGPKALPLDRDHRLHRFRARAQQAVDAMPAAERALLDRYVAGVNDGLNNLGARPFEYGLVGMAPKPWAAADSLLVGWAMFFDLQGAQEARELARGWVRENTTAEQLAVLLPESTRWDAPLDADDIPPANAPFPAQAPAWWGKAGAADSKRLALRGAQPAGELYGVAQAGSGEAAGLVGSNNWAVAGSRSQDGGAIVSDDMHLGLQLPHIWYRAVLMVPHHGESRRVVGVTLPGTPMMIVGSNGHVAWGYTNSYGDYLDLVALQTDASRPGEVRTPGGWEKAVVHDEPILVKGAPADPFKVTETSLGPVREIGKGPDVRRYALHWVAHAPGAVNFNAMRLEGADTLDEALSIANTMGIPAQNFVAGDNKGNIGWTIAGALPKRAQPGIASTFPLVADTAQAGWQGMLAPAGYPQVRNPANGQLSTANSRQLQGAGAQLLGDGGFDLGARTRHVRDSVAALGAKTDEQGVYSVALDDRAIFMGTWRDRALAVLDAQAVAGHPARQEARALLEKSWSGRASVDSVGYRIARTFMWSLYENLYGGANVELAKLNEKSDMVAASTRWPAVVARLLDEQPAGWLPQQYASWQALQLAALDRAVAELTKDGKKLADATWGARNQQNIVHPIANAVPALRPWLSAPADPMPGDSNMPRVAAPKFGQSERMVVSPGHEERAIFNMPGGQSGHPLSPYFLAGHADWVAGKTTPLLPGETKHLLTFVK